MTRSMIRQWILGLALPTLGGALYSCGSSGDAGSRAGGPGKADGSSCTASSECTSGACTNGVCGSGTAANPDASTGAGGTGAGGAGSGTSGAGGGTKVGGTTCTANTECSSGLCLGGSCASGQPGNGSCTTAADCASGVCTSGACVGNGQGAPSGSACTSNAQCASGTCTSGSCAGGSGLADGKSCTTASECTGGACNNGVCGPVVGSGPIGSSCTAGTACASGLCVSGVCASPGTGTGTGTVTTGPQWGGTGSGFRPLTAGCGPNTADQCTGTCEQSGGDPNVKVIRPPATLCFSSPDDLTPADPAVVIEQSIETLNGLTYVHLRVTFDPSFVDNTYGTNSGADWHLRGGPHIYGHTFNPDLVKSDHTELLLTDATGATVINFHLDYISADPTQPCGYGSLGATGGDGQVTLGDPTKILKTTSSLERNLNGCGYCKGAECAPTNDCTIDSPQTDKTYTANPLAPNWDYRVVYETWIDATAFGSAGFGQAYMTYVHASPNKSTLVSLNVTPSPCPPSWDKPYCPPSVVSEGRSCFGGPPGGGTGGSGNAGGAGGTTNAGGAGGTTNAGGTGNAGAGGGGGLIPGPCPVNYQIYVASEGTRTCTPIPFANYPNRTPCPAGYTLDLATEGQYCLPSK